MGCSAGERTSKFTAFMHLSSGSWVLSGVIYSLHFPGALCLYVGFLAQQSSESFLTTWWLASKRMKADASLSSAGHTTGSASFSWSKHVTSPYPRGGEKEPTFSLEDWLVYIEGGRLTGNTTAAPSTRHVYRETSSLSIDLSSQRGSFCLTGTRVVVFE